MKCTTKYVLISQELYWCSRHFTMNPREPAFSGRVGYLYKPSRVFHFKNTKLSPWPQPLRSAPAQITPPFKQAVHTGLCCWPVLASLSGRQSQCQLCSTRRQRHRLSDPAKDLGNSKTISPSTLNIKYTSEDACPEIVGKFLGRWSVVNTFFTSRASKLLLKVTWVYFLNSLSCCKNSYNGA